MMLSRVAQDEPTVRADSEERTITSEAQKWHDDHQAPLEIRNVVTTPSVVSPKTSPQEVCQPPVPVHVPHQPAITTPAALTEKNNYQPPNANFSEPITTSTVTDSVGAATSVSRVSSVVDLVPPPPSNRIEQPLPTPLPPVPEKIVPEIPKPSESVPPAVTPPPIFPKMSLPATPPTHPQPIPTDKQIAADVAKSPRTELEDIWGAAPPSISQLAPVPPVPMMKPTATTPAPIFQHPPTTQPSVPNTKTAPPPAKEKPADLPKNDRKASKGWFGSIKEKVIKSIPSANQMILPDDKKPSVYRVVCPHQ